MVAKKSNRKQDILQSLVHMLETGLGDRITTSRLAKQVGVSEAALYRHFPSKARMYESLLDFCEETILGRVNRISNAQESGLDKCYMITHFILNFFYKNAGICRLLTGEVFLGEVARLKERVSQLFDKLEVQIKQVLRNDAIASGASSVNSAALAKLINSIIEGRLQQFVRSNFKADPSSNWESQWKLLVSGIEGASGNFNSV